MRAVVAGAALVSLVACAKPTSPPADTQPSPAVSSAGVAPTIPSEQEVTQEAYTTVLRERFPGISDDRIREAMDLGHMVCGELDAGLTVHELNIQLVKADADPQWAGAVVGMGVRAFCPQHWSQIDQ